MRLSELTNGDLIRLEFGTGTAIEGRFMHNAPDEDTTSPEGPYVWFAEGVRVFDIHQWLPSYTIQVIEKWQG